MLNEQELVQACLQNDRIAQRKLYQAYAGKMMVVCMRYAKDRSEAEDVLQEAFVRVFQKLDTFKFESPLLMWIRKIVVNTALNHLRVQKAWQNLEDLNGYSHGLGHETTALDGLQLQDLLTMVQSLPNGCRTVFNLYAIEGYQHDEIAELLGISAGTSKSQYSRARVLLQDMVKKNGQNSANSLLRY
jgi:RNA polymerase sigma factor (sigma-70 family)